MHIIRPAGYPARFNTPDVSRHRISTRPWLPAHKVWRPLEVALLMPAVQADLIATFNRIPIGRAPFVISFESHLPRLFGFEKNAVFKWFSEILASDRCRRIIPISRFAQATFLRQHAASPFLETLRAKSAEVVYPAVAIPEIKEPEPKPDRVLRVFFAGSHFSRKGGIALLRAAEMAAGRALPIEFHIVSDLTVGGRNGVWTDPSDPEFFAGDLEKMNLPNVVHYGRMPNADLLQLLQSCDVSLLPTLSDTFGYSVLESMAAGVPTIGTRTCALPEIITDGVTGHLLDLETDQHGEWQHLFSMSTDDGKYKAILHETFDRLSVAILEVLSELLDRPESLAEMKHAAHEDARKRFDKSKQSKVLDDLYESVLNG